MEEEREEADQRSSPLFESRGKHAWVGKKGSVSLWRGMDWRAQGQVEKGPESAGGWRGLSCPRVSPLPCFVFF